MNKLISVAASAAMLLGSVSPALAYVHGSGASNIDTGRNSRNAAIVVEADVVLVGNRNMAICTDTTSMSGANSGANLDKNNDGKSLIVTHTATSGATADALVNATDTTVTGPVCTNCEPTSARNIDTGRKSENLAVAADISVVAVGNDNMAIGTSTTSMSGANSGANTAQGNDGCATIIAGSASSTATSIATVNTNVTRISR